MTATHETQSQPLAPYTDTEREVFTLTGVEEWREYLEEARREYRRSVDGLPDASTETAFDATIDEKLDDYLSSKGLDASTSAHYTEIHDTFRAASTDVISDDAWYTSAAASRGRHGGTVPSGRDEFKQIVATAMPAEVASQPEEPETPEVEEAEEAEEEQDEAVVAALEQLNQAVDSLRDKWSTLSAKRQGRIFTMKDKDRDVVRDEYHQKVQELGVLELADQIAETDDDTTKNAKVIAYLFEEQRKLREQTIEKLQGTKVGRFVKFMNQGSFGVRLLKGAGLGVAVGFGGGVLLGAAGAAGAAAAAIGASRFVKGYASNDRHRGMKTAEEEFGDRPVELEDSENDSVEQRFKDAAEVYNEAFEDDTKKEQIKRRKALAWGAGSVAVGATLGYAISNFDDIKANVSSIDDRIGDWWNDEPADLTPDGDLPPAPDLDNDGTPDALDPDRDNDGVLNKHDSAPNNPNVWEDPTDKMDWSDFARDARLVERGEGWYQTFEEMGIPQDHWNDVLDAAGPELHDQGWAYFDQSADEWRISQPGKLPPSALETIAEASRRDGFTLAA